jgi:hypothetical protein
MQLEKLYNLHKTISFIVVIFLFKIDKILSHQISTLQKVFSQNFALFENKKYTTKINCTLETVELFALYLVVYFVFFMRTD